MIIDRDNPESDIYGANLYDRYLQRRVAQNVKTVHKRRQVQTVGARVIDVEDTDSDLETEQADIQRLEEASMVFAQSCQSILVCTGVYCSSRDYVTYGRQQISNHNHRDFVLDPLLTQPRYVTQNVHEAVKLVFQKENVNSTIS